MNLQGKWKCTNNIARVSSPLIVDVVMWCHFNNVTLDNVAILILLNIAMATFLVGMVAYDHRKKIHTHLKKGIKDRYARLTFIQRIWISACVTYTGSLISALLGSILASAVFVVVTLLLLASTRLKDKTSKS